MLVVGIQRRHPALLSLAKEMKLGFTLFVQGIYPQAVAW